MQAVGQVLRSGRTLRVMGFDDAPFAADAAQVDVAGVVCAGTRFEGMVWGQATRDGLDATAAIARLFTTSKFAAQVHLLLLDGLAVGGFNLVDLPALAAATGRPCAAVLRRPPDFPAVHRALQIFPDVDQRVGLIERAGAVHEAPPFFFQVAGEEPAVIAAALARLTDRGHVPEALRLAHLIGSAVRLGESGRRA